MGREAQANPKSKPDDSDSDDEDWRPDPRRKVKTLLRFRQPFIEESLPSLGMKHYEK
jgi:hypothetical protein